MDAGSNSKYSLRTRNIYANMRKTATAASSRVATKLLCIETTTTAHLYTCSQPSQQVKTKAQGERHLLNTGECAPTLAVGIPAGRACIYITRVCKAIPTHGKLPKWWLDWVVLVKVQARANQPVLFLPNGYLTVRVVSKTETLIGGDNCPHPTMPSVLTMSTIK